MRARVVLGTLAVLVGLVATAGVVSVSLPPSFVPLVGLAAVVIALQAVRDLSGPSDAPILPEPERRHVATVPGDAFDDLLTSASLYGRVDGSSDRLAIRDRLETVAIDVLTRYDGDTPEEARTRLAEGTWTDDPTAAAFFSSTVEADVSFLDRFRFSATSDSQFRREAAHAVGALARHVEGGR
ncbi:DUF7269 family protein [Halomarina rubra]|uniref:DUF4129 domain-containing protein n=1 Tax=Halomarina rubra TaxID=2071873 RepID=A0ABD6AT69_9EURY|nr:hypothetical protein [Halomarina rubra]